MPAPLDPLCLFTVLERHGVDFVLIGGLAAVLHGSTVLTNDADIHPRPGRDNLERLGKALGDLDARVRSDSTPDGIPFDPHPELLASMALLNLTTRCGDLDLVFAPAGLPDYEALTAGAVRIDLGGVVVAVAGLKDIIRSKTAADRPKDRAVLPVLHALVEEIARSRDRPPDAAPAD